MFVEILHNFLCGYQLKLNSNYNTSIDKYNFIFTNKSNSDKCLYRAHSGDTSIASVFKTLSNI